VAELIQGMASLQKKLRELELVAQKKVLADAAKAGGKIVLEDAKRRAPRRSGRLADGITMRVAGRESDVNEVTVVVRPSRKTFWAWFNEKGTKNMDAQPFMKPALEANRDRVRQAIKDKLVQAINKAIRGG
jgi:HK97 gp10 family phage protein